MITKQQYQILNACADDWELFYFPFAMVNFGGQVFRRTDGPEYAQYEDERAWRVTVAGEDIASDVSTLLRTGLLACRLVREDGTVEIAPTVRADEFSVYRQYGCLTFDDHIERYGYGPHEFKVTERGVTEIQDNRYRTYDAELGWQ